MKSEHEIQTEIINYLTSRGFLAIRLNSGRTKNYYTGNEMKLAPAGSTDILTAVSLGRVLWIEVKTTKGKLSDTQEDMQTLLHSVLGQWHIVARSLEDVVRAVKDLPDGDPKLLKQILLSPKTEAKKRVMKQASRGYIPLDEWLLDGGKAEI